MGTKICFPLASRRAFQSQRSPAGPPRSRESARPLQRACQFGTCGVRVLSTPVPLARRHAAPHRSGKSSDATAPSNKPAARYCRRAVRTSGSAARKRRAPPTAPPARVRAYNRAGAALCRADDPLGLRHRTRPRQHSRIVVERRRSPAARHIVRGTTPVPSKPRAHALTASDCRESETHLQHCSRLWADIQLRQSEAADEHSSCRHACHAQRKRDGAEPHARRRC
jgi:hypothetical protein